MDGPGVGLLDGPAEVLPEEHCPLSALPLSDLLLLRNLGMVVEWSPGEKRAK